jgi:anthranilate phosphoribosyltransferase
VPALADALQKLTARHDLAADEATAALAEILAGDATPAQTAAFLVALRMKGETVEEITGLARALLDAAETVDVSDEVRAGLVDTCGTGGDRSHSVNVSTMAALVVAGAGVVVCKHGNRAASSATGSADLLEALGVTIDLGPDGVAQCLAEAGMAFCFAPRFHPAMRHVGPIRRELGVPTVFNFLGPLANPARVRRQLVGVSDAAMAEKMVGVLGANGADHVMVVYGHDGLDELTTTTTSTAVELRAGTVSTVVVDPVALGLECCPPDALRGGAPEENAAITRRFLDGEKGPVRDVVLLNAAAALVVAGRAGDLADGLAIGGASVDGGAAAAVLDRLVATSKAAGA